MAEWSETNRVTVEEGRRLREISLKCLDSFARYASSPLCGTGTTVTELNNYSLAKFGPTLTENTRLYEQLVQKTEGFDAGHWTWQDLTPIEGGISSSEIDGNVISAAEFAISTLNSQLETEEPICLQEVIRVTSQLVAGRLFYITMKASDGNFYEAKVYQDIDKKFKTIMMRIAKHYPVTDPEILQLQIKSKSEGRRR